MKKKPSQHSAAYLPGRNGLSSVKLMERSGGEQDTGEELGKPPTGSWRGGTDRLRGGTDGRSERERVGWTWICFRLTVKSPVKVFSPSSMTHTHTHSGRWTHSLTHTHSSSLWRCIESHWCRTENPQWRQVSQRERERERQTLGLKKKAHWTRFNMLNYYLLNYSEASYHIIQQHCFYCVHQPSIVTGHPHEIWCILPFKTRKSAYKGRTMDGSNTVRCFPQETAVMSHGKPKV